jgi:hypothetical protein
MTWVVTVMVLGNFAALIKWLLWMALLEKKCVYSSHASNLMYDMTFTLIPFPVKVHSEKRTLFLQHQWFVFLKKSWRL